MGDSRTIEWSSGSKTYTEEQIIAVLKVIGVDVRDETNNDFLSYCPYHGNRDTPAFSTSKVHGASVCFNPACGAAVSLEQLVKDLKKTNVFQTRRLIAQAQKEMSYAEAFDRSVKEEVDPLKPMPHAQERLDRAYERFWNTPRAIDYMLGRHFDRETLDYFRIGYGPEIKADPARGIKWKPESILVPMYDPNGEPLGYVGRSIEGKSFNNSYKLPKTHTMWNLHHAKRYESVVVVEASFDAMRVHQAGYPNVVALLGGHLSKHHIALFKRYFTKVIIMTDDDNPEYYVRCAKCRRNGERDCQGHNAGRDLGMAISEALPRLRVSWATFDDTTIYPQDALEGFRTKRAKDAGDMTDEEIRQCLRNAISDFDYREWLA